MQNRDVFGIIKFFNNEEYLSQLCGGKLYCNTPEFYRLNDEKGISDRSECCSWSFRKSRGDAGAKIVIGGHVIDGLTNVTIRSTGMKDSWLHCWTTLTIPQDEMELENLVNDLRRIRSEFGLFYAYIPPANINPFIDHIKTLSKHEVKSGMVMYSDKHKDWSIICKSTDYRYQREFRIVVGECQELSTEPLILEDIKGFNGFLLKNISIDITSSDYEWIWFRINGDRDIVHNQKRTDIA